MKVFNVIIVKQNQLKASDTCVHFVQITIYARNVKL
jgi:hypothetical protein